jgi:hypothetical protein
MHIALHKKAGISTPDMNELKFFIESRPEFFIIPDKPKFISGATAANINIFLHFRRI